MGRVHVEGHVDAPVEHVFSVALDVDRIPDYNPYMEVRNVSGPLDHVGTTFDSTLKILGRRSDSIGKVIEVEPDRLIHIQGENRADGSKSDWIYRFIPEGPATQVSLDVEYTVPGGVLGEAMDRLVFERSFERAMRHMAENFTALAALRVPQHA
jgi:coenzyme Q-binding protein COQ10